LWYVVPRYNGGGHGSRGIGYVAEVVEVDGVFDYVIEVVERGEGFGCMTGVGLEGWS
jgi:hypothetical protein